MSADLPIPFVLPEIRHAIACMFIDLTLAIHAIIFSRDQEPPSVPDADLALVAAAVSFGHAEGRPMNASQIAKRLRMPPASTLRRLDTLIERGVIQRIKLKYYLEPVLAANVPDDSVKLILSKAFAVLGPHLSKLGE